MTKHFCAFTLLFVIACGGGNKEAAAPAAGGDECPNTPEKIRSACGCRPTEKHYISAAGQLGSATAKAAATSCATGTQGADGMPGCMKEKGASSSTLGLIGKPVAKDDDFNACVAKTAP